MSQSAPGGPTSPSLPAREALLVAFELRSLYRRPNQVADCCLRTRQGLLLV